jgi:hypothetical protein
MGPPSLVRRASAEAVGTFTLATAGCGAIVVDHATGALGHGGVAASFVAGFWPSHWIYWVGPITGAILGAILCQALRADRISGREEPRHASGRRSVEHLPLRRRLGGARAGAATGSALPLGAGRRVRRLSR